MRALRSAAKLHVVAAMFLAFSECQGRCKFEYIRQPVTALSCNPFDSQYQPPRVSLKLECEVRKNGGGGGGSFDIEWFRRNSTGIVENLIGATKVTSQSPLMKRSVFNFSNQTYTPSLVGEYWCQVTNTGSSTPQQQSNALTLLTLGSYRCYNICSDAQSMSKMSCASALSTTLAPTDLDTATEQLATCQVSLTSTELSLKLTPTVTGSSLATEPTTTSMVVGSTSSIVWPAIITAACIVAIIIAVAIITLLLSCVWRRRTLKTTTTESTENILEGRVDGMVTSVINRAVDVTTDPPYSNPHYHETTQHLGQTMETESMENPHEEPTYSNPHYFQGASPDHDEAQEDSNKPAHYQPLHTDTRDYTSVYSTTTEAGRRRAPSVEVEGKLYSIVDSTRREEHTYTTPQQ